LGRWYFSHPKLIHQEAPEELKPHTHPVWHYSDAHELARSGIYSDSELEKLRKQLLAPITRDAITSVISQVLDGSSITPTNLNFHKLIDHASLEIIASDILDKFWGWLRFIGNLTSGCVGLYVLWKFIKYLFDVDVNTKILYDVFGWSVNLVASVSTTISKYLIHRENLIKTKGNNDEQCDQVVEEQLWQQEHSERKTPNKNPTTPCEPQPSPYSHLQIQITNWE
jgi:hypothetical protein